MCNCVIWPLTCVWGLLTAVISTFFTVLMIGAMVHFRDYLAIALPLLLIGYLIWMVYECLRPTELSKES